MIKFFRKIRQQSLTENKFSKYLIYAIGEIILVVIGILIALNINNRNDEISKRQDEQNFYSNTKQQLLDDASNIKSQIEYNSRYTKQFKYAIELIEINDRAKKDSLGKIAVNLTNYSDFDRQGNIYETMVNSGDIKLLKNNEIIERLRQLEETYIYANRMETIHFDVVMTLVPEVMQSIRLYSNQVENENYLFGFKFQNLFVISLRIMDEKDDVYNRALDEIASIIGLIDNEKIK
ncbi:MAG: hypothetical protein BM563_09850 [Bacteroidetes bacterium MedPE-SWsnd-G1]|nr:MAG: hypothetical protein BM563_09850 [Bacteroidetes bacterium MedPE-SWsnd-G1]